MSKLAIFDFDGTLIDSRATIREAMELAFAEVGLPIPTYEDTRQVVGLSLAEACFAMLPRETEATRTAIATAYVSAFATLRAKRGRPEALYEGAVELLVALRNDNWRITGATGKSRTGVNAILGAHDLHRYFDGVWCADDGPSKPHPHMILSALTHLDHAADRAAMVGDTSFDMIMAKNADVRAIGVCWGFHTADEIMASGADEIHHTFDDLAASLHAFGDGLPPR